MTHWPLNSKKDLRQVKCYLFSCPLILICWVRPRLTWESSQQEFWYLLQYHFQSKPSCRVLKRQGKQEISVNKLETIKLMKQYLVLQANLTNKISPPSLSLITKRAAAPPDCATFALVTKSQSPRTDKASAPENYKIPREEHLYICAF